MQKSYLVSNIEDLYKTGIYKITCTINNKIYIGSACGISHTSKKQRGFAKRWQEHINRLRSNSHRNKHLQSAWDKYGEDSFIFEIIEFCNSQNVEIRENYYINFYKSFDHEIGFNILGGHLANYKKKTQEQKDKISLALKGKKRPLEIVKKWSSKVQQINNNGIVIAEYYSMSEAERQTGIMRQDIGQAIIGRKMKKAGGYFWKKVKDIV